MNRRQHFFDTLLNVIYIQQVHVFKEYLKYFLDKIIVSCIIMRVYISIQEFHSNSYFDYAFLFYLQVLSK